MELSLSEIAEQKVKEARFTSWFFTGLACFFLVVNFLFILTLYQMAGRLKILSQLFVFLSGSPNLVLPEAINGDISRIDFLNEVLIRDFVSMRHGFVKDVAEMRRRWMGNTTLRRLWNPGQYAKFLGEDPDNEINQAVQKKPNVEVDIRKVTRMTKDGNNWQVEFDMIYADGTGKLETYIATLRTGNYPSQVYYGPRFNNPLGLGIIDYVFTPKETEQK